MATGELSTADLNEEIDEVHPDTVLIAGAGPVGLLLSIVLSFHGVRSILLERNLTTTRYVEDFAYPVPVLRFFILHFIPAYLSPCH
jgi:threonine dehydrogenase-like Zn-dependent dehydrogenase